MGIDGIGSGGRIPPGGGVGGGAPATGTSGPSAAKETGRAFEVSATEREKAAAEANAAQHVERSPLERLRAGEVDVNGYVDLKVSAATKNLTGLSRVELDQIRGMLKHQIANDPAVADLVKQATGAVPGAKPEGE